MEARVTLKRAVVMTARRGTDTIHALELLKARAVQGDLRDHAEDKEVTVQVHTAFTFESEGVVEAHPVGGFKLDFEQCYLQAKEHFEKISPTSLAKIREASRQRYWALDNREPAKLTIPYGNVDGIEELTRGNAA